MLKIFALKTYRIKIMSHVLLIYVDLIESGWFFSLKDITEYWVEVEENQALMK